MTTRFEPIALVAALGVLAMLSVPREFEARALEDGGPRIVDSVGVSLGLQTGEGLFASAVALVLVVLCAQALVRGRPLVPAVLAGVAVVTALAVTGLADLTADMPEGSQPNSVWCASDPVSYYEPDLEEHFRELNGNGACVSGGGSTRLLLSWLAMLVLAVCATLVAFSRASWRRAQVVGAIVAPAVAVGLLFLSLLVGLQHLE